MIGKGLILVTAFAIGVGACAAEKIDPRAAGADPGRLLETLNDWSSGELPRFTDVTDAWGLGDYENTAGIHAAGGVALGDLDGDGWPDIAIAGGDLQLFYGGDTRMTSAVATVQPATGRVASVGVADLDVDGFLDILVGIVGGDDLILWGGSWSIARDPTDAERSVLQGGAETVGLLAADLGGDGAPDILRLSHDPADADIVWVQTEPRSFAPNQLPQSFRRSFAAEIADLDHDGLLDIWITRDVGWITGPDSIYSRQGEPNGPWVDVAPEEGAALAIDGMGIALADLNGDGGLDAYVSDVGENDILMATTDGQYVPALNTGAGRIRPIGAPRALISSSWAVAAGDLNLDGNVDLVVANGGFGGADIINKVAGTDIIDLDTPALFLGTGDGVFADVWPQLGHSWAARIRGLAVGDLDRDGDSDLLFVSTGSVRVYRNDLTAPSVTVVAPDAACAAGFVVAVAGPNTEYRALLMQHPFLGSGLPSVTVGTEGGAAISVIRPGSTTYATEVQDQSGRTTVEVPCT